MTKHIHSRLPQWPATSWTVLTKPDVVESMEAMVTAGTVRPGVDIVVCERDCADLWEGGFFTPVGRQHAPPTP